MALARYWRVVGLQTYGGGDLELSQVQLWGTGLRLDQTAALACSATPISGTLANLADASLVTTCRFAGSSVHAAGFWLMWDFGAAGSAAVAEVRIASGNSRSAMLSHCDLQYSDDGQSWLTLGRQGYFAWVAPLAWSAGMEGIAAKWSTAQSSSQITLSADGLVARNTSQGYSSVLSTLAQTAGKWYVEVTGINGYGMPGVAAGNHPVQSLYPGGNNLSIGLWGDSVYVNNAPAPVSVTSNGTVGLAIDLDARTLRYLQGGNITQAFPIAWSGAVYLASGNGSSSLDFRSTLNVGGTPFVHAAPAGFSAGFGSELVFPDPPVRLHAPARATTAASAPVPAHSMRRSPDPMLARDVEFGGAGRIWGTAETEIAPGNKVPTKARISLLRQRDRLLARETWSDPVTGAWEVHGLDTSQQFIALAQDPSGAYRPVAADQTTPEANP